MLIFIETTKDEGIIGIYAKNHINKRHERDGHAFVKETSAIFPSIRKASSLEQTQVTNERKEFSEYRRYFD